jgi:hypothetical protein
MVPFSAPNAIGERLEKDSTVGHDSPPDLAMVLAMVRIVSSHDGKGEQGMGERGGGSGAAAMERLREQMVGLADADRLRPEDEETLLAALDAALEELVAGDMAGARAGIERFVAGAEGLIAAGVLAAAEGDPPLAAARALLAEWRG